MKKIKHLLPLLLIALLLMGLLPLGAFAQEGASTDPAEATPTPAAPGDIVSSGSSSEEAPPPAETAAPTATPAPTPAAAPTETPAPTEAQEVYPPSENEPYFEEPWGEGIFEGPNNPPEGSPLLMTIAAGTATIAVRGCYDSSGSVIKYASSFYYDGRWVGGYGSSRHTIYANEEPAYCLEPGKYLVGGNTVTTNAATIWNGFSSDKREAIKLAILCGAEGNSSNLSGSYGSQYTATQMVIWEFVMGVRSTSSPYSLSDSKVINSVCSGGANSEVRAVYDQIIAAMQSYNTLPSFAARLDAPPPQHDLQYSDDTYSLTLTDTNYVLPNFNISCTDSNTLISVLEKNLSSNATTTKNALEGYINAHGGTVLPETDEYGHTSASGLPLGLYLVVEVAVPENVTCTTDPFLVSLPMTTIDGEQWMYDVTLYPKNNTGSPTLEKTVREAHADTGKNDGSTDNIADGYAHTATGSDGDVMDYQIISTLPVITSAASQLTTYTFVDTLSQGITYNRGDVVIEFFRDKDCTEKITTWAESDGKFNVEYAAEQGGSSMTITMTDAGLAEINTNENVYGTTGVQRGYSACTLRITYAATVNSDASVVYGDGANPNEVVLQWRRTNSEYYDTLNDDCHVYVYGLDLTKEFSDGAGNFDAVKMVIHNDTDGYFVQAAFQDGVYFVTGHTESEAEATVFTPSNKHIIVKGLEDDTYSITETATDDGYTLLKEAVKAVISTAEGTVCDVCHKPLLTASASVNGNAADMTADGESAHALVQLTVVNTKGFDLPQTGSNGTWLYTTIGIVVMAGAAAVIFFIIRRKNSR